MDALVKGFCYAEQSGHNVYRTISVGPEFVQFRHGTIDVAVLTCADYFLAHKIYDPKLLPRGLVLTCTITGWG
jgi:hypothetical protein